MLPSPPPTAHAPPRSVPKTSLAVFQAHLVYLNDQDPPRIDAHGVISRECYDDWLSSRGTHPPGEPEKTFQRILTAHLTASDGRRPFPPAEEEAILVVLREKRIWPAFEDTGFSIGTKGFRAMGWHEKRTLSLPEGSASTTNEGRPTKKRKSSSHASAPPSLASTMLPSPLGIPGLTSWAPWAFAPGQPNPTAAPGFFPPWLTMPAAPPAAFFGAGQAIFPATSSNAGPAINPSQLPSSSPSDGGGSEANSPSIGPTPPSPQSVNDVSFLSDEDLLIKHVLPAFAHILIPGQETRPTKTSIGEPMAALSTRLPGPHAMFAINLAPSSKQDLVLAQNAAAEEVVGQLVGEFKTVVPQSHLIHLGRHVLASAMTGRDVSFSCPLVLADGTTSEVPLTIAVTEGVLLVAFPTRKVML